MNDFTVSASSNMDTQLEPFAQFVTFLLLVGAVIFFIYYRRQKKRKQQEHTNVTSTTVASVTAEQKQAFDESTRNYDIFEDIITTDDQENHILKYEYEQNLCLLDNVVASVSGNGGVDITFEPESDNEYDPKTISIYLKGQKIGYVYKGRIRDMLQDWIDKGQVYRGYINKIFVSENKVTYKLGFYVPLSRYEHKEFSLIKTRAKADDISTRWENLLCCEVGEEVHIDQDGDSYYVYDYSYNELGELSASAITYIKQADCQKPVGIISSIDEEARKAKIIIYLVK